MTKYKVVAYYEGEVDDFMLVVEHFYSEAEAEEQAASERAWDEENLNMEEQAKYEYVVEEVV